MGTMPDVVCILLNGQNNILRIKQHNNNKNSKNKAEIRRPVYLNGYYSSCYVIHYTKVQKKHILTYLHDTNILLLILILIITIFVERYVSLTTILN